MHVCVCVCVCVCSVRGVNQTALGAASQLLNKQRHGKTRVSEFESSMWLHVRKKFKILKYLHQAN